jgi:hypothetical protein
MSILRRAFVLALISAVNPFLSGAATNSYAATLGGVRSCDTVACDQISQGYYGNSSRSSGALFSEGSPSDIYSQRSVVEGGDGSGNYSSGAPGNNGQVGANSPNAPYSPSASASAMGGSNAANGNGGGFTGFSFAGSTPGSSFIAAAPGSYIDNAIVGNMFRFRFDSAYGNPTPDRAEFFYGQCGCFGGNAPGPLLPDTNIDYQEFRPYLETALTNRLSLFVEAPIRLINPDVNPNAQGFSDLQVGFKRALVQRNGKFLTAQLRMYTPTGNAFEGLGTGHFSIEPGLLYLNRVSDRTTTQGEFQVWIPTSDSQTQVGGVNRNFAGTVLRYGVGGGYDLLVADTCRERRRLTGVLETVGWSVLDGLVLENGAAAPAQTTIVNIKSGLRYTAGNRSIAASYGRAVTGDVWYRDILRLEYRYAF